MGRDALPVDLVRLGGTSSVPRGIGRPTRRFGRGREAHLNVWEGSAGPSEDLSGVASPTRRSGGGFERPSRSQGRVVRTSRKSWRGRVSHKEVWE